MDLSQLVSKASVERPMRLTRKTLAYLETNLRYLRQDPQFFWMKTLARFELARDLAARPTPVPPAPEYPAQSAVQTDQSLHDLVAELRKRGMSAGLRLAPDTLAALLQHCQEAQCFAERDARLPFLVEQRGALEQTLDRPIQVASYFNQQEEWPAFRALRDSHELRTIAAAYLGCEPVYMRSEISWSFPGPRTRRDKIATAQVFHCDINDFKTLKFFFYLTEVGPGSGPHQVIAKSPKPRSLVHQAMGQRVASLPEHALREAYEQNQMITVCGPAGLGFVSDPYYYHRGCTPTSESRLLLQIEVGCRRYNTWYFDV
jgi:hypothetical protein